MDALRDHGPAGPPTSLYVHVPFCRDRCTYCAFATVADDPAVHRPLVDAVVAEASRHALHAPLATLYIGGGTPGLLRPPLLERLLAGLARLAPLSPDAEVTLEVNPANVTAGALRDWASLGVTRVSLGVQTFRDDVLHDLARRHDGEAAHRALALLADCWHGTWSADLIVGWRGQRRQDAEADVEQLLRSAPPHVSVYGLTVEPHTPLERLARQGRPATVGAARAAALDDAWSERLLDAGYERYEVSNFARPGHRSRHNQVYWRNESYLGLGPGAASSVHPLRWSNLRELAEYLAGISAGRSVRCLVERVAPAARLAESLAIGLRTADGLDVAELDRRFTSAWRTALLGAAERHRVQELLVLDTRLRLAPGQLVRADRFVAELAGTLIRQQD